MLHAWRGYVKYAFGANEVRPMTKVPHAPGIFGKNARMGATIVDALDTLYIMGLHDEYDRGRDWIVNNLKFDGNVSLSLNAHQLLLSFIFLFFTPNTVR